MQQQAPIDRSVEPPAIPTKKEKPKAYPERITQMQCLDSNSELQLFFVQALTESFKYLPGILAKIYNEIQLLVGLAEYRLTIARNKPHPGDLLQNIQYKNNIASTKIKIIYLFLTVILPYLKKKIEAFLVSDPNGWKQTVLKYIALADKLMMILNLVNFSIFIRYGKYRNVTQRLLKLPMQFITGESARVLDFTLMNRKIIWNIYELFLKTILPYSYSLFGTTLRNIFYLNSYLEVQAQKTNVCMFCEDDAKMPMKTECQHVACYYCYKLKIDQQNGNIVSCRKCGAQIKQWKKMF